MDQAKYITRSNRDPRHGPNTVVVIAIVRIVPIQVRLPVVAVPVEVRHPAHEARGDIACPVHDPVATES